MMAAAANSSPRRERARRGESVLFMIKLQLDSRQRLLRGFAAILGLGYATSRERPQAILISLKIS
jgi:hypothetical protein